MKYFIKTVRQLKEMVSSIESSEHSTDDDALACIEELKETIARISWIEHNAISDYIENSEPKEIK